MFRERSLGPAQWNVAVSEAEKIVAAYRAQAPEGFDPQCTFVAVAIGGAAVVAAGATAYSQSQANKAQAAANQKNQDIAASDRALAYQMFLQSRGSEGSALLPMYGQGVAAEQNLFNQAWATYLANQQAMGSPAQQIAGYQNVVQGLTPAMNRGDALVNDLFSGQLAQQQIANAAPVQAARAGLAGAQQQGIYGALRQQLNAMDAKRALAGYSGGGSSFQKAQLTGATIPAFQQAATVGAQADLQNAAETAAIKQQDIATRLGNLNLPLQQAANRIQLATLPIQAEGQNFQTSLTPFNWFKMQPQAFQPQPSPTWQPVGTLGQALGQGVAQGASSLGNYYANVALVNQLKQNQAGTLPATQPNYGNTDPTWGGV